MSRIKTTTYNSFLGIISFFIIYIANFIYRTCLVKILGIQFAGITGLFGNILSIFSLSELGIGSAITIALYKTLEHDDKNGTITYLQLLKLLYKYIGIIILITGLFFLPFLTKIIKTDTTVTNIHIIYLLYLLNLVSSYAFFAYYQVLITADRKSYKLFLPQTLVPLLTSISQVILMFLYHNFLFVIAVSSFSVIFSNIWIMTIIKRNYPYIILKKGKYTLPREEQNWLIKYIKATFLYKVSEKVLYSTDSVLISSYLGLSILGIYSNYLLIIDTIKTLILTLIKPFAQAIGSLNISADIEYKRIILNRLNFFNFWVTGFCTICFALLLNPFIDIWLGEEFQLSINIYYLLIINFYTEFMPNFIMMYRDSCGLNIYGKYRPLITAFTNILLSLFLVNKIGLIGIFLGTFISRITTIFWYEPYLVYSKVLKKNPLEYFKDYSFNTIIVFLNVVLLRSIFKIFWKHTIITFFYGLLLCLIVPNLIYWLIYRKNKNLKYFKDYFLNLFKLKIFKVLSK